MKTTLAGAILAVGLAAGAPAGAHHAVGGEYDPDKPVTVTGVVSRIDWTNPHARVHFDVKEPDGTVSTWSVELAARNVLERMGWTGSSLKIGQTVTVTGDMARSGAKMLNARAREQRTLQEAGRDQYSSGAADAQYPIVLADGTPVLYDR